jgi:3-hydroxy acid dehydrogenase/malonic semialdehyde reductase
MQNLTGRLALVTGASSGIGASSARALSAAGAHVICCARRKDALDAVVASCDSAEALVLDVTDSEACAIALSDRPFDIVLANAGKVVGTEGLADGDPDTWSDIIDTNVKGVLNTLHPVLAGMRERGSGHVITIGSVAGRQVYPGGNVYCASKFAVRAIYEGLRLDLSGSGLRFTTVDPGMVETELSVVRFRGDQAKADAVYAGMTPLEPEDVADAVLWAATRPAHVDVGEIVLWPTDQASTTMVTRSTNT